MKRKIFFTAVILLNLAAVACLVYFAVPLIAHDTFVPNPDAMIPMTRWEGCGTILMLGLLPMAAANGLMCLTVAKEKQAVASIRSRYGGYYNLRVYDGGFLLMGDGESNLFSVLVHADNRRIVREMIPGKLFERRIDMLSDGWYCIYLRR